MLSHEEVAGKHVFSPTQTYLPPLAVGEGIPSPTAKAMGHPSTDEFVGATRRVPPDVPLA